MRQRNRKKSRPQPLSRLFGKILPQNYRQKYASINQYQQFFLNQESDAVFQLVKVLNASDSELSVSVPSSALVNYLRLHSQQIGEQIHQQFGVNLALKIKAMPESEAKESYHLKPPQHFSQDVVDQMKKSSSAIDDEALRKAMQDLANAIKK